MVDTIKFSEFAHAGDLEPNETTVGVNAGVNARFNNPFPLLPPGTTAERPAIAASMYYRLRFNTSLESYEYYSPIAVDWIQLEDSGTLVDGPFVLYTADPSLPSSFDLGTLTSGLLKQAVALGISTPAIALLDTDYYGPGMTGPLRFPSGVVDTLGANVITFSTVGVGAVNYIDVINNATGSPPAFIARGPDANIGMTFVATAQGPFSFNTELSTSAFYFATGTANQHITNFTFANTAATRDITWPDASGTVALTSGASGIINPGLINELAYYAAAGTTLSGLTTANSSVLVTGGTGIPSLSTTLPTGLAMQTPASIVLTNGTGLPLTTGVTGILPSANGGTGVNNGASTITLGGSLTTSGAFASTFTMTGVTGVTFPTSGTLATVGGSVVSLQGTANQVLVNGTSGSAVTGTAITLTTPQDIATSSTPTFNNLILTGAAIQYTGGFTMLGLGHTPSAVNSVTIFNNVTGAPPSYSAQGTDANVGLLFSTKATGIFQFASEALTNQVSFLSGTALAHTSIMNFPATAASRTYTWPDATGTMLITGQAINSVPSITFSSTSGVIGTTTNDSAAAGSVGEYITSNVPQASAVSIGSSGATINVTSISLTAGDWDVYGNVIFLTTTASRVIAWTSNTSATIVDGSLYASQGIAGGVILISNSALTVPFRRVSLSGTTTVYLSAYADFPSGTVTAAGTIYARRVR